MVGSSGGGGVAVCKEQPGALEAVWSITHQDVLVMPRALQARDLARQVRRQLRLLPLERLYAAAQLRLPLLQRDAQRAQLAPLLLAVLAQLRECDRIHAACSALLRELMAKLRHQLILLRRVLLGPDTRGHRRSHRRRRLAVRQVQLVPKLGLVGLKPSPLLAEGQLQPVDLCCVLSLLLRQLLSQRSALRLVLLLQAQSELPHALHPGRFVCSVRHLGTRRSRLQLVHRRLHVCRRAAGLCHQRSRLHLHIMAERVECFVEGRPKLERPPRVVASCR